jgi:hypothetical protein
VDFLNTKVGTRNVFVLGPMHVVRANVGLEFNYESMEMEEVDGYSAPILTEVVEWPFAVDAAGIAFPGNIYGVRTRCWRRPMADGGGDKEWWTAVPKSLPSGYTPGDRYSGLEAGLYADYLGDNPMLGTSWNRRTATGLLLNSTTDPDGVRALWTPMNLNQEVLGSSTVYPVSYGFINDDDPMTYDPVIAMIAGSHIGFRGAKITATIVNPGALSDPYPHVVERELHVFCAPVTSGAWLNFDDPPEGMVDLGSFTVSHTFTGLASPGVTQEIILGDLKPTTDGILHNFFIYGDALALTEPEWLNFISLSWQLSPRVDVPLCYDASMGNRVAPGGYINPS